MNLKCRLGFHPVPKNIAFHEMGAIFSGGICPRCGKLVQREFIQNVWTEEIRHDDHTELKGFDISKSKELGFNVFPLEMMEAAYEKGVLTYE